MSCQDEISKTKASMIDKSTPHSRLVRKSNAIRLDAPSFDFKNEEEGGKLKAQDGVLRAGRSANGADD